MVSKHTLEPRLPEPRQQNWPDRLTQRLSEWMRMVVADLNRKVGVRKAGTLVGTRDNINLIEGTGVTLTMADDPTNDEVDVTIAASGGSSGCCDIEYFEALGGMTLDNTSAQAETCTSSYSGFYASTEISNCSAVVDATVLVSMPASTASATSEAQFYLKALNPTDSEQQISCYSTLKAPAYDATKGQLTMAISLHGGVRLDGTWTDSSAGDWRFFVCGLPTSMSLSAVTVQSVCMRWFKIPCSVAPV